MWFGTHHGASRYDGKTFTNFWRAEGLHGPGCKILVDRDGQIWAGTNHGVFRFNGSSFSEFSIPKPAVENLSYKWEAGKIWDMMQDKKGNIWLARDGFGACRFDGTSFTHFTKKDGLCSNNVSTIMEDRQGNIWFGSLSSDFPEYRNEGGLSRYDGKTFTRYPELKGLEENDIYTIYEDKKGNTWIGAVRHGAYRYDGEKFTFFNKTDRPDLTVNFAVQGILEDRNGTLWFGFSGGLFRFNDTAGTGTSFMHITQQELNKSELDAHSEEAPYHLPAPKNWGREQFPIPIGFAPQIPYKGVEDIRFAPGWGNVKSDEYWTYAFLWYLDASPKTDEKIIAENLKAYYSGLIMSNADSATAAGKAIPVTASFKKAAADKDDLETYTGSIEMLDYMQRKPIILNCIVHLKACPENNKTILFYELSPKPFTHSNWSALDQLWSDFRCKKSGDK